MPSLEERIAELKMLFGDTIFDEFAKAIPDLKNAPPERMVEFIPQHLNGNTSFWRQDLPFDALKRFILPQYRERVARVASVGCSNGSELYSILLQNWPERDHLELAGYDCSHDNIKIAREGGPYCLQKRKLKEHRGLRAYGEGYYHVKTINYEYVKIKITKPARQRVTFETHDITKAPLPQQYDIIFLMHVLCHYSPQGRKIIVNNARESLASGGWLICEVSDDGAKDRSEYNELMHQLNGFTRPAVTIPWWSKEPRDVQYLGKFYQTTK